MNLKGRIPALIASYFTLGSIILWIPGCVQGFPSENVTLSLQYDPPMVDVSGGSNGIVDVEGCVNVSYNGTDAIKVFLKANSDLGSATVNPSIFEFHRGNESTGQCAFKITTRIPQGNPIDGPSCISVSGYIREGNLSYPLSNVDLNLSIRPCFAIEVGSPPPQEIGPGEFVYFVLRVTNTGNVEDTYEFNFYNLKHLCSNEWTIGTLTPKTIGASETRMITVSAQAPQTWTSFRNRVTEIKLEIISQKSRDEGGNVKEQFSLFVRERGSYIPGFTPSFAIMGIILVSLVAKKQKWMRGMRKPPEHPKDLYSELSMSMR